MTRTLLQKKKGKNKRYLLPLVLFGISASAACNAAGQTPPETVTALPDGTITTPFSTPAITAPSDGTPSAAPTEAALPAPSDAPTAAALPTVAAVPTPSGTLGELCFSEAGYLFPETVRLELSTISGKSGYITYTMDGAEPSRTSARYTEPLFLESGSGPFPNVYSVCAKAWYDDGSVSDTYVHTYFVNTEIDSRYTTAIFSINGNPSELTEGPDGILYGTNYEDRGRASERKVHLEALSADGTLLFSQFAGVRVFGGSSRKYAVKSLKLFARKEYEQGKGTFSTSLFGSATADGLAPITRYDKLVLRNGGDDFGLAFLRDELVQRLAIDAGFSAYEAVVPALAYINGSYYGFYWLHESYCDKYFQYRNGRSDGEYIILEGSDSYKSIAGNAAETAAAKEYNALYRQYAYADLTAEETFAALCSKIDVENYMDYMAYNIYIANHDWPHGNYRCFRYYAAEGEAYGTGERDGRFRFLLHDCDDSFAIYTADAEAAARSNDLEEVLSSPSGERYSPLLAALLKREDCKQYFIDKMLEYMNGALSYDNVCKVLDKMCAERDTELAYYYQHLASLKNVSATPVTLERHLLRIRSFAKERPAYMLGYLEDFFHVNLTHNNAQ